MIQNYISIVYILASYFVDTQSVTAHAAFFVPNFQDQNLITQHRPYVLRVALKHQSRYIHSRKRQIPFVPAAFGLLRSVYAQIDLYSISQPETLASSNSASFKSKFASALLNFAFNKFNCASRNWVPLIWPKSKACWALLKFETAD